jgi:2-phosphosulfolactate phosphatase
LNVRTLHGTASAKDATGTAVIIDVFRAFTTAAFCVAAGASDIVLVKDHEQALAMKRADPALFLTGEIGGRPIDGFDAGNSPSRIEGMSLSGRRVVQRTSSGTQAVVAASGIAERIVLGSFVIAAATARYVRANAQDVTLVATSQVGLDGSGNEDPVCARYLEALLRGDPIDARPLIAEIWAGEVGLWPDWFPRRDAELATEIDRFDFALVVEHEGELLVARPVRYPRRPSARVTAA